MIRIENIVGKGEITGTSNISLSIMFSEGSFPKPVKRCHFMGMGQLFSKRQNFRLVQIESICRRQKKPIKMKFYLGREENIVEKGENAGYQHFLLFPQCFQKLSFS